MHFKAKLDQIGIQFLQFFWYFRKKTHSVDQSLLLGRPFVRICCYKFGEQTYCAFLVIRLKHNASNILVRGLIKNKPDVCSQIFFIRSNEQSLTPKELAIYMQTVGQTSYLKNTCIHNHELKNHGNAVLASTEKLETRVVIKFCVL